MKHQRHWRKYGVSPKAEGRPKTARQLRTGRFIVVKESDAGIKVDLQGQPAVMFPDTGDDVSESESVVEKVADDDKADDEA